MLGEESKAFREKVKSLLAPGKTKIVLNLAQVGYVARVLAMTSLDGW